MTAHFLVYSRPYCHLCTDLEAGLQQLQTRYHFSYEMVDIDKDPLLEERYGTLIPVVSFNGRTLCNYFLDEAAVVAALAAS